MPALTRAFTFLVPGDWQALTGGYVYNRRIVADQMDFLLASVPRSSRLHG